jgi:hypothetical protein
MGGKRVGLPSPQTQHRKRNIPLACLQHRHRSPPTYATTGKARPRVFVPAYRSLSTKNRNLYFFGKKMRAGARHPTCQSGIDDDSLARLFL